MSIFNRHESCRGITLFRWGQRNVELWYCPAGYEIKPHSHNNEDIELMYLFGKTTFWKRQPWYKKDGNYGPFERTTMVSHTPKWTDIFTKFTVPAGTIHWFTVSNIPLVFINISTFKDGCKPISASKDFQLT